jgi:putative ABC transport system permease protein
VGDALELTPVRGQRKTVEVPVVSIVQSYLGLECYADISYLSRIVGEAKAVNSVQMSVNTLHTDDLYRAIKKLPNAQGLSVRENMRKNIEGTFVETMLFSMGIMIIFAGVIGFGSVLNLSMIEVADRTRDIAGFRVLGYRPSQIAAIFFRQNLIVFLTGLLLGLPLGYGLVALAAKAYETELYRLPVIVKPATVVISGVVAFVFIVMAQWFVYRQIQKLDWLEGIKVQE